MTKVMRMLAGGGLAAVFGVMLLGFSGAFSAHEARAESPPNPPSRFAGSVLVDGAAPPAGTSIEARVGSATCGVTTTFNASGQSRYTIDVPALDPGATPNCGTDGATVTFLIGGKQAAQTGSWANYKLTELNLTYTTPPTPTPAASASPSPTPKPPATGSGTVGSSDSSLSWTFAALGLGALAFGVGGAVVARKRS
ncbi:MAG: hypothetical protein HYX53_16360 [Chloroflexi bacterium]|nr:hypothetical protein [Chloroflexota bacterium]